MSRSVAFQGPRHLVTGSRLDVALALHDAADAPGPLLAFDLETGAEIDFDLSGSRDDIRARYGEGRPGRPKLGVVAREVTLLPRHWDWLQAQRGGASAALRRLVEAARAADRGGTEAAAAKAAAYRILAAMAGDLPNFEAAARALFADDRAALRALTSGWPADLVAVALARLGANTLSAPSPV